MKNQNYNNQLDEYLDGLLSGTELTNFENKAKQDEELADEIQFQKELFETINDQGKRDIRSTLNQIHEKKTRRLWIGRDSWKLRAVAAAIVILLVSGGVITNYFNTQPVNQVLYDEYFNPESSLLSVRSGNQLNTTLGEGMLYYEQGKYADAIESFYTQPDNMLGKLYTGFSFMKLEKYELAESPFNEIIVHRNNLYVDQAEWNLGLCYLKSGKINQAVDMFNKISISNTAYNTKASHILQKMKDD